MAKKIKRLYSQFAPEHYDLQITPNRLAMTFSGTVIITGFKHGRPSKRLTFHQKGLKIVKAELTKHDKKGDEPIKLSRLNLHETFNEVRVHTEQLLYPGKYTVTLEFSGKITRPMEGIYPCSFKHQGKEKKLIATQFESHYAREVFPCIDEPEAKAIFQLTLATPKDETVLSNTPAEKQTTAGTDVTTTFKRTPKMPTYLLAFIYGELAYKEAKTKSGVMVRTHATPDNVAFTEFALEVAVRCLEFYDDYFGLPYPLEKCDLIALPDFASGAMENWGCVTFREQTLLVDPQNSSLANKQYVAMVVAHELAHQWFGNLVTMRWWTDLWLNEGFASWVEYLAVDHIFPEWQMWTQFIVDEQQPAMKLDALTHTHPIEVEVKHPDEIHTTFDTISYGKGASVIHMLQNYLGAEDFRAGLRYYLSQHSYGNTVTTDLWKALEEASNKPVKSFMHQWTTQPGLPLVEVVVSENSAEVRQCHFAANVHKVQARKESRTWPVALLSSTPLPSDLFTASKQVYRRVEPSKFKLNMGQSGFYRVMYNASHIERLAQLIKRGHFSPLDRLGLLSDSFEIAKAGYGDTLNALHLLEAYEDEADNAVWDIIAGNLGTLRLVMDDEQLRDAMKPFMRRLAAKQLKRLGWEEQADESHFDKLLRPTILGMEAFAEEPTVVKRCLDTFKHMKQSEDVAPNLRSVIYGTAVRHGDKNTFNKLLAFYDGTNSGEEHTTLAAALTGFKQAALVKRALALIATDKVRLQDVSYWVAYSFMNRYARHATWEWMVKQWEWLQQNLGNDLSFYRFPLYAARPFSDKTFLKQYRNFFDKVTSPALERSIEQGAEIIEWQAAWKERDFKAVKHFFES